MPSPSATSKQIRIMRHFKVFYDESRIHPASVAKFYLFSKINLGLKIVHVYKREKARFGSNFCSSDSCKAQCISWIPNFLFEQCWNNGNINCEKLLLWILLMTMCIQCAHSRCHFWIPEGACWWEIFKAAFLEYQSLATKNIHVLQHLVSTLQPDIIWLQETKLQVDHVKLFGQIIQGNKSFWNCSTSKKG